MAEMWVSTLKWFTDLTAEKAVIVLLIVFCGYSLWTVYDNKDDFKNLQDRYDKLSSERIMDNKECNKKIDSLNAQWLTKFDSYRALRETEIKQLAAENQRKVDEINRMIWDIQFKTTSVENRIR